MVSTAGGIVIAIIVIALAAAVGWIVFTQMRARRLGLPPPTLSSYLPWHSSSDNQYGPPRPAPGGVVGWFNDQIRKFKNRNNRSAAGAYEEPLQGGGGASAGRRGFGPLDPDEAWDARVGHEADSYGYYEETELSGGPAPGHGGHPHQGDSYGLNVPEPYHSVAAGGDDDRGRKTSRAGDTRNPFDDDAASSLRGVSPRPMEGGGAGGAAHGGRASLESQPSSPTSRRSAFREDV